MPASLGLNPVLDVGLTRVLFSWTLRSIAPCGACHGAYGVKAGAPLLAGQKAGYLDAQLRAFATDARTNDINAQMRGIAKNMRSEEMADVSRWYGSASSMH